MRDYQNTSINNRIVNIIIAIVSVLLLFYTGYRAATLSFTIDESISFNTFVPLRFMGIVSYQIPSSNHHMLNTLCMKMMSALFGTGESSLRFPSLVSHLIYIIFSFLILKKISSPYLVLAGFLLLNLNPYLLDFFSLARGYAMAVSFTMVSLYYLFNYVENNNLKYLNWSLIFAILAVLSNFSLLIYYVSLVAVFNTYWIANQNANRLKKLLNKNISIFISTLLLIIIMFEPIRKLIKYKEFYDGGLTGFWNDTVGSLISATLYEQSYQQIAAVCVKYFVGISSIAILISLVYNFYNRKWKMLTDKFTVAVLLLFISCFVSIAQHLILKSNFLINRMALFFIPLFFISLIILVSEFTKTSKWQIPGRTFIYLIAGAFCINALISLNTSYVLYWKFDADTKKMLSDLEMQVIHDNKNPVKLGVMKLYEPAINFYRVTKKYDWLEKVTEDGYKLIDYDYYYLGDSSMNFINNRKMSVIKHYPVSNSCIAK